MIEAILDHSNEPRRALAAVVEPADDATGGLIRRHWASVRRYLRILGAEPAAADDLAQDVFVVALRKGIEDRGARTAAWLRRTARFLFLDHSRKRRPLSLEVPEEVWQEHGENDAERQQALRACLPKLAERSQTAVRLAYGERQSWAQIGSALRSRMASSRDPCESKRSGSALGMRASGVKTLLRRCRATLKECIERATTSDSEVSQ
jgi:RNA polymerase sigma factor (sigma-70 family)